MKRDTSLDGKPLPGTGYYWSPAVADKYVTCQVAKAKSKQYEPKVKSAKVGANAYYTFNGFGNKIISNVTNLNLVDVGVPSDKVHHIGKEVLGECEFALYNQHTATKSSMPARNMLRERSWCIQDSGGFQLATGVADFVDPIEVARMHNLYADSGVSLDLPLSMVEDANVVAAGARMLAANSSTIKSHLHKDVQLMNVCHGGTLKLRNAWLDIVLEEPLDSMCIAGLRATAVQKATTFDKTSPKAFLHHVLLSIIKTKNKYQHYHVLGVATGWQMGILALIARIWDKTITSDSASHSLAGKSGILINYAGVTNYRLGGRHTDNWLQTQCNCKVCSALEKQYWYNAGTYWFAQVHNLAALHQVAVTMREIADAAITQGWPAHKICKMILANAGTITYESERGLRHAVEDVLKITKLSQLQEVHIVCTSQLFGKAATTTDYSEQVEIIRRYEKYHKTKFFVQSRK